MKKVSIIYWSNGGNVEVLADHIARGAEEVGADVTIKLVQDAEVEDVTEADAVAFGSPSMDNNQVEQHEMAPFIDKFKLLPNGNKPIVLFGSFGWDNGKFMEDWEAKMKDYGFDVLAKLTVKETPNQKEVVQAEELGRMLAK